MKKYFRVYSQFIRMNISEIFAYRIHFINSLIGATVWGVFHVISVLLLTSTVSRIYGWTSQELIILTASFSFLWGFFHFFFAPNFEDIPDIIDRGDLDFILLKPIDSQLFLTLQKINFSAFIRTLIGIVVLFIVINGLQLHITMLQILSYLFTVFMGLILIYSLWFFVSTFIIWFPRLSNLTAFLFLISGISRYPPEILQGTGQFIFLFLLPIFLFVSIPTKVLLHKALSGELLLLFLCMVGFFLLARYFWKFALRHYTSASS